MAISETDLMSGIRRVYLTSDEQAFIDKNEAVEHEQHRGKLFLARKVLHSHFAPAGRTDHLNYKSHVTQFMQLVEETGNYQENVEVVIQAFELLASNKTPELIQDTNEVV